MGPQIAFATSFRDKKWTRHRTPHFQQNNCTCTRSPRSRAMFLYMTNNERIDQLKAILAADEKNTLARYALGMEYSGAGQTDVAVTEFKQLLSFNPDYTNAYFMAAQALANADRKDEAKQWLQDGLVSAKRAGNKHAENEMQAMLDELEF